MTGNKKCDSLHGEDKAENEIRTRKRGLIMQPLCKRLVIGRDQKLTRRWIVDRRKYATIDYEEFTR